MNNKINIIEIKEKFEYFCQCKLPIINIVYSSEKDIHFTTNENKQHYDLILHNDITPDELVYMFALINDDRLLPNLSIPIYKEFRASLVQFEYLLNFKKFKSMNLIKYNNNPITVEFLYKIKNIKQNLYTKYNLLAIKENTNSAFYLQCLKLLYKYIVACKLFGFKFDNINSLIRSIVPEIIITECQELLNMYIDLPEDESTLRIINDKEKLLLRLLLAHAYNINKL